MPQAYRLLSYDFDNLQVASPVAGNPVDVTPGRLFAYPDGILLHRDPDTLDSSLQSPDETRVRLTFDFSVRDVVDERTLLDDSFLLNQATLRKVEFQHQDDQQRFGHLLSPEIAQERRQKMRMESVEARLGKRPYAVVRAMDARSSHTHAMDYVYLTEPALLRGAAQAVLKSYEEGDRVRTPFQRMLMKTLEHAVTTAIYEQLPQHVTYAISSTSDLYKAPNEGEFFFDAEEPLKMQVLLHVDEHGVVSLPKPAPKVDLSAELAGVSADQPR